MRIKLNDVVFIYNYMESLTMANNDIKWSEILNEAMTVPGRISDCYSTFYNYSIGNQLLAYSNYSSVNYRLDR